MTDRSKLTKAQLLGLIEDLEVGVVQAVKAYPEGCDEGRIAFLRDAGIPDDAIAQEFNLVEAPRSVMVCITVEIVPGATPLQVANEIEAAIDDARGDYVDQSTAYIAGIVGTSEGSSHMLAQEEWRRIDGKITHEDTWEDFENID